MSNKIALTQNEFNLLLRDNHPDYDACESRNRFIEDGSGCDRIFERVVIRESDKAEFKISFIHNSSFGDFQDWIHDSDCDFYIDSKKEDIYDCRGQLLSKNLYESTKESEPKTVYDIHEEMKEAGKFPDFEDKEHWLKISVEELTDFMLLCQNVFKKDVEVSLGDANTACVALGVKYTVNIERLWYETFQNRDLHKLNKSRLKKYFENRKSSAEENKITVQIGGKDVLITEKELNKIAQQAEDLKKCRKAH